MPDTTRNLATQWVRLMSEWDAALAEYRAALAGSADPGRVSEADSDTAVQEAAQRLADIKQRMDEIIVAGRKERLGRKARDHLVVATLDLGDTAASTGGDADDSSAEVAARDAGEA